MISILQVLMIPIAITGIIIMGSVLIVNNNDVAFKFAMIGAMISISSTGAYLALDKIKNKE